MNKKRLFVAINLPEEIKKNLFCFKNRYLEIPARWTKKENLHITLYFIGYVSEKNLEKIRKALKEITLNNYFFELSFVRINYGPPESKIPRMIWVSFNESKNLLKINQEIEKNISEIKLENFMIEKRNFSPHITLARIRQMDFKKMNPEELPKIDEEIGPPAGGLTFNVCSIELMESNLKRTGAEYKILESFSLKQNLKN